MKSTSIFATDINVVSKKQSIVSATSMLINWMSRENSFFTTFMEESISNKKALLISHAALSFSVITCSVFLGLIPLLLCTLWFGFSLYLCKKGGVK